MDPVVVQLAPPPAARGGELSVLHVHTFGDPAGEPLLAVHGITGHGRRFRRLAEEGWPHRRTYAVDLRGHGRSLYDGPWSMGQHVIDVFETMEALGLADLPDGIDLVGHSYGGAISANLLANAPEVVRRLVMLDPAFARPADAMNSMAAAEIAKPGFASYEEALAAEHAGYPDHAYAAAVENVDEHLIQADDGRYRFRYHRPAVIAGWGELCNPVPLLDAPRPALVVVADRAGLVTPEVLAALHAQFDGALDEVHLDSGHTLDWERFDETAGAVTDFVS